MIVLLALVASPARAAEPTAEAETVAQVRHDLFGDSYLPGWEYLRFRKEVHGPVAYGFGLDAYLGLAWDEGLDRPMDFDVYTLAAEGEEAWGHWVLGRQQAFAATRPQTFDGARVIWRQSDRVTLGAWAGQGRHQDLDDLADGLPLGRVEATVHDGGLVARGGVQLEAGDASVVVVRQDAEARLTLSDVVTAPDVAARLVLAEPDPAVEWARFEAGFHPVSGLRASVHAQHRESVDPNSLFGDKVLEALAGGPVNSAGASVRLSGRDFATLYGNWSLTSYDQKGDEIFGHEVDLAWTPGAMTDRVRVSPGYTYRSGPGGLFHAGSISARVAVRDDTDLSLRGAVVPYRKGRAEWEFVVAGGCEADVELRDWVRVAAAVDAASDALYVLDVRGTAVLTLAVP